MIWGDELPLFTNVISPNVVSPNVVSSNVGFPRIDRMDVLPPVSF